MVPFLIHLLFAASTLPSTTAPFIFHAEPRDSLYVRQARDVLCSAYEEIAYDLNITQHDTLNVLLAPSRRDFYSLSRGRLPSWAAAFASPVDRRMVIKSPRWNRSESTFESELIHELSHLLLHRRVAPGVLPRWLDEGLALFYSRDNRWRTSTALSKAILTRSLIPLADIDYVLNFHRQKAELAYQECYSAVYYLLTTYDIDAVRIIVNGLRDRQDIDQIFLRATGSSFSEFEREWLEHAKKSHRWTWATEVDQLIWLFIPLLAVAGYLLVRRRNRAKLREWDLYPESE